MKHITSIFISLLLGFSAFAQQDTIRISTLATSHVRFASDLKYVDISNRAIIAKIVDGSKDILALKAREAFDFITTISCLEASGAMHTFFVAYSETPSQLVLDTRRKTSPVQSTSGVGNEITSGTTQNDASGLGQNGQSSDDISEDDAATLDNIINMPKRLYHIGTKAYGIEIYCDNILVHDDIMYLVFSIDNHSAVSYAFSEPRFAIESKKRSKRKLVYEKQVFPRIHSGASTVAPTTQAKAIFAFDKTTLLKGQVFRAYFYEFGGSRNFILTFDVADINMTGII